MLSLRKSMSQKRSRKLKKLSVSDKHYQALKEAWKKLNVIARTKMYEPKN
jgi:hypothetical protein